MKALFKSQFPFVELEDSKLTDKQKEIKVQYVEIYKEKEANQLPEVYGDDSGTRRRANGKGSNRSIK